MDRRQVRLAIDADGAQAPEHLVAVDAVRHLDDEHEPAAPLGAAVLTGKTQTGAGARSASAVRYQPATCARSASIWSSRSSCATPSAACSSLIR